MVNKEIDSNTDYNDNNNDKLRKPVKESITKHKKSNENIKNTIKVKNEPIRNLADENYHYLIMNLVLL